MLSRGECWWDYICEMFMSHRLFVATRELSAKVQRECWQDYIRNEAPLFVVNADVTSVRRTLAFRVSRAALRGTSRVRIPVQQWMAE